MQGKNVNNSITCGYARFLMAWYRYLPGKTPPEEEEFLRWPIESYTYVAPKPKELLEIFADNIDIIKLKLQEYQDALQDLKKETEERTFKIYDNPKFSPKLREWILIPFANIEHDYKERKIKKQIGRLDHLLRMHEWKRKPKSTSGVTDDDIAAAKEVELKNLLNNKRARAGFYLCPFHSERTPSFKLYRDNRYHCFGCGENGDAIDYVMKHNNISFVEAVKYLIKR